jgi:hypothetical protein
VMFAQIFFFSAARTSTSNALYCRRPCRHRRPH